jgi:hypothetical protein
VLFRSSMLCSHALERGEKESGLYRRGKGLDVD